jgi:hypothetical protein
MSTVNRHHISLKNCNRKRDAFAASVTAGRSLWSRDVSQVHPMLRNAPRLCEAGFSTFPATCVGAAQNAVAFAGSTTFKKRDGTPLGSSSVLVTKDVVA